MESIFYILFLLLLQVYKKIFSKYIPKNMAPIPSRAFNGSNRSQMGSNVFTVANQGGGSKKAGFPYQVGRDSWSSIAFQSCNPEGKKPCASLKCLQFTKTPLASISRPIGSTYRPNTYFHIGGTR